MNQADILLVIEGTYPWYRGGVSEWVHQYITACSNLSFHIVQVATDQYLNASINDALYGVPEHVETFTRIPPPDLSERWEKESHSWKRRVRDSVAQPFANCDIIHIANTGFAGWLGKEWADEIRKPLLLTEHALYWKEIAMGAVALECGYQIPKKKQRKQHFEQMFKDMASDIYSSADQVISVSECNISEQKKLGAQQVKYIPNGIPRTWVSTTNKVSGKDPLRIGWIGRCAEMKNPLKFFDVIQAARDREEHIEFLMLCCDANEPQLAEQVKQKASQFSELTLVWNKETKDFIDQMDVLCITSHNESQPLVLFEALARKVLPIGWQAGDVTSSYGLVLSRDKSCNTLLSNVLQLWNKKEKWLEVVDEKSADVAQSHTWAIIFGEYKELIVQLLQQNKVSVE